MLSLNNWITSNFLQIAYGKSDLFQVQFHPYKFTPMPFNKAAEYTAMLISEQPGPLYVGLTGGADSEFVARTFVKYNIPFNPIIVSSGANSLDVHYAKLLCEELTLVPIIVKVTEDEVIRYYIKNVAPANSDGLIHVHQMLAVDKAKELGGTIVLGETHVFDPDPHRSIVRAIKFLPDIRYDKVIPFYYYTLELTYAEMAAIKPWQNAQEFKAYTRGTKIRGEKIFPKFNSSVTHQYYQYAKLLHHDLTTHDMGTPQLFLKYMESFIQ